MTTRRDPDALLSAYLADGMDVLPDRVVDAVLDEAHRTRQRAVFGPWRTPTMNSLKLALAGAAVVVVVVAGLAFLPRTPSVGGPPEASPSPSSAPSASPTSDRMTVAGSHAGDDGLQLTVDLPDTWTNNTFAAADDRAEGTGSLFFVSVVDNTFSDPCGHIQRSPQVEPTIAAWASALGEIPDVAATEPTQTTFAGYPATFVELTMPASLTCASGQFYLWQDSPNNYWWATAPNETIRVWMFDVSGRPVAIAARSFPGTVDAAEAELQAIFDSIVFDPASGSPSASPSAS
jgi:hypothetical protein